MTSVRFIWLVTMLLLGHSLGCAMPQSMKQAILDPGKEHRERKEEIHRLVDQRHVESRIQAASAMLAAGKYDDTVAVLKEIEKIDPNCRAMHLLRAEVFMSQNKFAEAASLYENMLETSPSDAHLHHLHAMALEFSGDSAGAMLAFQRAADLSPDNSLIQLSQIRDPSSGTTMR